MNRKVLITGATGDTGRAAVKEALALGLDVRAMVHSHDGRSEVLKTLGAEVLLGDLLEIVSARQWKASMWPISSGLSRRA